MIMVELKVLWEEAGKLPRRDKSRVEVGCRGFQGRISGCGQKKALAKEAEQGAPGSKAADGKRATLLAAGRADTSPPDEDPAAALVAPADPQQAEGFVCFKPKRNVLFPVDMKTGPFPHGSTVRLCCLLMFALVCYTQI